MSHAHPNRERQGKMKSSRSLDLHLQSPLSSEPHGSKWSLFQRTKSQPAIPSSANLRSLTVKRPICSKLRDDLQDKALRSQGKDIFLRRDLVALFCLDEVSALLQCECQNCEYWRKLMDSPRFHESKARQIIGQKISLWPKKHGTYVITLSLLVYLGLTPFIYEFLKEDDHSDDFLQTNLSLLSPSHLLNKILPRRESDIETSSLTRAAKQIDMHKYQFFIREVDDKYEEVSGEIILPFLDEQRIGDGGYGTVFQFRIDRDYLKFADPSGTGWFARKVFKAKFEDEKLKSFSREVQNLERVKNIHPRLIKYHKAFIYGGVSMIIFPLAKSDLRKELLKPRDTLGLGGIRSHEFWDQLIDVSRALAKLHSYNVPDVQRDNILYFYHFDLKPANILIGNDGSFLISDFGQAHLLRPENGAYVDSSVAADCGGDPSYAPPENESSYLVDGEHLEKSRKYDTWCLGCIFLEVLWYVVKGRRGTDELECLRNLNSPNDNFYYLDQDGAHLKKDLEKKTGELKNVARQSADQDFISRMVNLIFAMLNTNPRERHSAEEVVDILDRILGSRAPVDSKTRLSFCDTEPGPEESITSNIQSSFSSKVRWTRNGEPYHGEISLKRHDRKLSGTLFGGQHPEPWDMGELHALLVVPFFALYQAPHLHQFPESDIAIVPKSYDSRKEYADRLKTTSQEESLRLLGDILGQRIAYHEELTSASFEFSKSAKVNQPCLPDQDQAGAVQIWVDRQAGLPHMNTESVRSRVRRHSYHEPATRRLVIYMYKSIFLFKFAGDFKMNNQTGDAQILEWVPNEKRGVPFNGLVFLRSLNQPGPGIPMDEESLAEQNMKFSLIRLTFKTPKDRYFFGRQYLEKKAEWRDEKEHHKSRLSKIAEEKGLEFLQ